MREISILEVLPEGRAVVATEGRFRVVVAETGEIIDDLSPSVDPRASSRATTSAIG